MWTTFRNFFSIHQEKLYILSLVALSLTIHHNWWFSLSPISGGDWYNPYLETSREYSNSYATWLTHNLGVVNTQIPSYLFFSVWSLISNISMNLDLGSRLLFFYPISLLKFLAPYVLVRKLTNNYLISFSIAFFYGTTTYGIVNQVPIQFIYVLTPLIFYLFLIALEKNKLKQWTVFVLIYFISICYEIRIILLTSIILALYFVFFQYNHIRRYLQYGIMGIILLITLNSFWLLPTLSKSTIDSIQYIANRGLFGNWLYDLPHAITAHIWYWTGVTTSNEFIKQPIIIYFWLIPITAFSSFLFISNRHIKNALFYMMVALLGIFLSKQQAAPFSTVYQFLYDYLPGFSLYREASKFYLLTSFGYMGLLSYGLLSLKDSYKKLYYTFAATLIVLSLINTRPFFITDGINKERKINSDYGILNHFLLKQPEYFRTLWIPTFSRWGTATSSKPFISYASFPDYSQELSDLNQESIKLTELLQQKYSNNYLDLSSVKYIIVPIEDNINNDNFFIYYGKRNDFIRELDEIEYLKAINIGTTHLRIYENLDFKPHIYISNEEADVSKITSFTKTSYKMVNPAHYKITINNPNKSFFINFSENYNSNWKIKVGSHNFIKAIMQSNYYLADTFHEKNSAGYNSFFIDKANFKDQSVIEINLFFKPQAYFYLGRIISLTGIMLSLLIIASVVKHQNFNRKKS